MRILLGVSPIRVGVGLRCAQNKTHTKAINNYTSMAMIVLAKTRGIKLGSRMGSDFDW